MALHSHLEWRTMKMRAKQDTCSQSLSHNKIQCDRLDPIQQEHGAQPLSAQQKRLSSQLLASIIFIVNCKCVVPKPRKLPIEGPFLGITGVPQM